MKFKIKASFFKALLSFLFSRVKLGEDGSVTLESKSKTVEFKPKP